MAGSVNKVILVGRLGKDPENKVHPPVAPRLPRSWPPTKALRIKRAKSRIARNGTGSRRGINWRKSAASTLPKGSWSISKVQSVAMNTGRSGRQQTHRLRDHSQLYADAGITSRLGTRAHGGDGSPRARASRTFGATTDAKRMVVVAAGRTDSSYCLPSP